MGLSRMRYAGGNRTQSFSIRYAPSATKFKAKPNYDKLSGVGEWLQLAQIIWRQDGKLCICGYYRNGGILPTVLRSLLKSA